MLLRDGALSDPLVVEIVRSRMVPVWVNIRTTAVPDLGQDEAMRLPRLDEQRRVAEVLNRGFLVRSIVVGPDGRTILNVDSSGYGLGMFPYGQTNSDHYVEMLQRALRTTP